jgi:VanZ family protein
MIFFKNFWPALAWAVLVLVLTGLPGNSFPEVVSFWKLLEPDKIVHFFIFGIFTVLLARGLSLYQGKFSSVAAIATQTIGTGIAYGGITEIMQAYVFTGRTGSINDFIANSIGCVAGYIFFKLVLKKSTHKAH